MVLVARGRDQVGRGAGSPSTTPIRLVFGCATTAG